MKERATELGQVATKLEQLVSRLEHLLEEQPSPRRMTVDHTAPADAPNSYEAVLAHFRRLGQRQAQEFTTEAGEARRKLLVKEAK